MKRRIHIHNAGIILGLLLTSMSLTVKGGIHYVKASMIEHTYPFTYFNSEDIGSKPVREIEQMFEDRVIEYLRTPIPVSYGNKTIYLTPHELGVQSPLVNLKDSLAHISEHDDDFEVLLKLPQDHMLTIKPMIDTEQLQSVILTQFSEHYQPPQNASLIQNEAGNVEVISEITGQGINTENVIKALTISAKYLEPIEINLNLEVLPATITAEEISPFTEKFAHALHKKFIFKDGFQSFNISFENKTDWIDYDHEKHDIVVKSDQFLPWFEENVATNIERERVDTTMTLQDDGLIAFDGNAKDGKKIIRNELLTMIADNFDTDASEFDLPIVSDQPLISASDEIKAMGITDLIGSGYTDFRGSIPSRIHNIKVGLNRFNGVVIAPGETFSFVERMGPVDETTGYQKALVIKQSETTEDYGGGLCQVSTTAFRAALWTGLPINERSAHSYAVSYYARPGGQGLDATIYPGSRDLKFTNDTQGHIVLQTFSEGTLAFFNIFGTPDDRRVTIGNNKTWDRRAAPPDQEIETDTLKPGEKKVVEKAITGFSTSWDRTVTKDGEEKTETFTSVYKPWAKKTLVGKSTDTEKKAEE